jgi:hypothetical protein
MRAYEPRLEQLLADPLVRQMMASDGVQETEIRRLAERITSHQVQAQTPALRLRSNPGPCTAWAA